MRKTIVVAATATLLIGMVPVALAGGMAITVFDSLPDEFQAGESYTLDYSILQHGVTPVESAESVVTFTRLEDGEIIRFEATETGDPGRYRVDVRLPHEGTWSWEVSQGPFAPHPFGTLTVAPPAALPIGFDLIRWILPLGAVIALWYTVREARSRAHTAPSLPEGEPV